MVPITYGAYVLIWTKMETGILVQTVRSKEKIKLSIRDEFVCPECGEPLTKIKGGDGPNWKLIGKIIAAILVLVGLCISIYFAFFNKSQPVVGEPPKPDTTVVNKEKDDKEKVDETKEIVDIKQLSIKDAKDFTLATLVPQRH